MEVRVWQLLVVIAVTAGAWAADSGELAFKSCKSPSGVPTCKVKAVFVDGCQKDRTHDMNHIPSDERDGNNFRNLRRFTCDVSKKTQLNFTINIHSGFSTDRLSSQFSVLDPQGLDCSPEGGAGHCLFREYVRNGCRGTSCPLGVDTTQDVTDFLKVNPDSTIGKNLYNVQWKLWNKSNKKENCCFTFKLRYY